MWSSAGCMYPQRACSDAEGFALPVDGFGSGLGGDGALDDSDAPDGIPARAGGMISSKHSCRGGMLQLRGTCGVLRAVSDS